MSIDRLSGLKALVRKLGGTNAAARVFGYKTSSFLSQMLNGGRPITEKTAYHIERTVGLPDGWLLSDRATISDLERRSQITGREDWFGVEPRAGEDDESITELFAADAEQATLQEEEDADDGGLDQDIPMKGLSLTLRRTKELGVKLPMAALFTVAGSVSALMERQNGAPLTNDLLDMFINVAHQSSKQ